ncbi:MAG: right-handed parallel beta-helix repeat-containing protein [Clostridiales bacterium]|nr:right-handed parallel beta-helix repeat-containing protein [Clostridiales bacterium]
MKRKKILSLLVSLAMALSMLPTVAFAADADVSTEQELLDAIDTAEDEDTITLSNDIDLSETLTIDADKNITIDLAGHAITGAGDSRVITVDGELTLEDSGSTGTITGGSASNGGGVYVTGTFTMNGGTITGNTAIYGGGVYVYGSDAVFNMNGGIITNNTAEDTEKTTNGGGIYINKGTVIMTDGEISENTADSGAGVCIGSGATFTMSGGSIESNTATTGGAVLVIGTFEMSGGTITGNEAANCGGVYINNGTFDLNGGEISGNISTGKNSAGIVMYNSSELNISGKPVVTGNLNGNNVEENVYLADGQYITLVGELESEASIGVTTQILPTSGEPVQITTTEDGTEYYATAAQYFIPDAEGVLSYANSEGYVEFVASEGYHTVTFILENATTEDGIYYAVFEIGSDGYTATIIPDTGYELPATIIVEGGGSGTCDINGTYGSISYNDDGTITVKGHSADGVTGKDYVIKLTAEEKEITYTVTFNYDEDAYTVTLPDSSVIESGSTVTYVVGETCEVTVAPLTEEYELPDEITIFAEATGYCEKGSTYASNQVEYTDEGVIKITGVTWTNDNTDGKDYIITIGTQVAEEETYDITVEGSENVSTDPADAAAADTEVTVTPEDGYIITEIAVEDENGNDVLYEENEDGTYTFTMPESAVVVTVETAVAYTITFELKNVTIDPEDLTVTCAVGDTYTVKVTPDEGYTLPDYITIDAQSTGTCNIGETYPSSSTQVEYTTDGEIIITGIVRTDDETVGKNYTITISAVKEVSEEPAIAAAGFEADSEAANTAITNAVHEYVNESATWDEDAADNTIYVLLTGLEAGESYTVSVVNSEGETLDNG